MIEIEEIDRKTYNPNVYFSSADNFRVNKRAFKKTEGGSRLGKKKINYSLADMETQIYQRSQAGHETGGTEDGVGTSGASVSANNGNLGGKVSSQVSERQMLQSEKRFFELDTENTSDLKYVPQLLSSLTGINKDKLIDSSASLSQQRVSKRFEMPKNIKLLYKCTKPPDNLLKKSKVHNNRSVNTNKNKTTLMKKILSSKRSLSSYIEGLDRLNFKIIFKNVYNKRFFKVLRLMNICSNCGNSSNLSQCIKCHGKICNSVNCYILHGETRCDG
ncbi:hypothetical protein ACO0QE_004639 [Hanseniaspora vineae]